MVAKEDTAQTEEVTRMPQVPANQLNQNLVDLINQWKTQKIWRGTIEERKAKFQWLHDHMKILFEKPVLGLEFGEINDETERTPGASGASFFNPDTNIIKLNGKLSAITFIHEWGHALGMNQEETVDWSWLHFKACFPCSAARLAQNVGTMYTQNPRE